MSALLYFPRYMRLNKPLLPRNLSSFFILEVEGHINRLLPPYARIVLKVLCFAYVRELALREVPQIQMPFEKYKELLRENKSAVSREPLKVWE
jgi:hypothetical protein